MKKVINLFMIISFILMFSVKAEGKFYVKEGELTDIIVFKGFNYCTLKDESLREFGIDVSFVKLYGDNKREITESNYKEVLNKFENVITYEYKDIFCRKVEKNRRVYVFSENNFRKGISIDNKYKIKEISVDIIHDDSSLSKILVGKIITEPKLPENKNCYILKLDRNNEIVWGKIFENSKINKFNKIIDIFEDEYCLIASAYRNSEWTDGFILKFNKDGDFLWQDYYGSSHIDDFKDVVCLENGEILVLAEVSNSDGDVKAHISINNPLNKDLVLIKYDISGKIVWQNSVSNESAITALKIVNDEERFLVLGELFTGGENKKNIIISAFDTNGKKKFSTIINDFEEFDENNFIHKSLNGH